ncbi:MAG TPA: ferrochelatase [Rhodospirillales bacterium]|nr:ferrochelatase [Rhodospirillales bacterium]
MSRVAVILFNLGGPDGPGTVRPFLFNLFNDPAIIKMPGPLRWFLAKYLAAKRTPAAQAIYAQIGGRSPLLDLTLKQAHALEDRLNGAQGSNSYKAFIAMRYWHPFSHEAAREARKYDPDKVILLPLYPQFSTTTTGSSLKDWKKAARRVGLHAKTYFIEQYPAQRDFIKAHVTLLKEALLEIEREDGAFSTRVLFSAHGLPKKIVAAGDPYPKQVEETVHAVVKKMANPDLDWVLCYQSRVGPLEWIGPSTDAELRRAGRDKVSVVVVPIAFVSEHSETLVELDIEYRDLAKEWGVPRYYRVPALGVSDEFIEGLANLAKETLGG